MSGISKVRKSPEDEMSAEFDVPLHCDMRAKPSSVAIILLK